MWILISYMGNNGGCLPASLSLGWDKVDICSPSPTIFHKKKLIFTFIFLPMLVVKLECLPSLGKGINLKMQYAKNGFAGSIFLLQFPGVVDFIASNFLVLQLDWVGSDYPLLPRPPSCLVHKNKKSLKDKISFGNN